MIQMGTRMCPEDVQTLQTNPAARHVQLASQLFARIWLAVSLTLVLATQPACTASGISATCGDGILGPNEDCEPRLFSTRDCSIVSYKFIDGKIHCSDTCRLDFSSCILRSSVCGNGVVEPGENCDDSNTRSGDGCSRDCRDENGIQPEASKVVREAAPQAIYGSSVCSSNWSRYLSDQSSLSVVIHPRICRVGTPLTAVISDQQIDEQISFINNVFSSANLQFLRGSSNFVDDAAECEVDYATSSHIQRNSIATEISIFYARNVFGGRFPIGGFANPQGIVINASVGALGHIIAHELGHVFGLDHPHDCYHGIETIANCTTAGDQLCSTPPDPGPAGISGLDRCSDGSMKDGACTVMPGCGGVSCPGGEVPNINNLMSY